MTENQVARFKFMNLKKTLENRFLRFLIVGCINTLFGYGLFSCLLFIGLHYSIASALGTIGGVLFNYQTTRRLVFSSKQKNKLTHFSLVYLLLYTINVASLAVFDYFTVNLYLAGALLILPMAALGFMLNRLWVFTDKRL